MHLLDRIEGGARVSIEVLPPSRGGDVGELLAAIEPLVSRGLAFVSVTDHPGGEVWAEGAEGARKVALRTKPGTLGTACALREAFGLPVLPHIVASGARRLEVEDLLIDLHYAGFRDLFVVRGDERYVPAGLPGPRRGDYAHAVDLLRHVAALNRGEFTPPSESRPTAFSTGVAAYPEKHFEAPNLEADLLHLREKVEAGADFVITQMVFSAERYRALVGRLRSWGVEAPVIPGIKPVSRLSSISGIPRNFHVDIPGDLVGALEGARSPEEERRIGAEWTAGLCRALLAAGAPCLHFFTMGKGSATLAVLDALGQGG